MARSWPSEFIGQMPRRWVWAKIGGSGAGGEPFHVRQIRAPELPCPAHALRRAAFPARAARRRRGGQGTRRIAVTASCGRRPKNGYFSDVDRTRCFVSTGSRPGRAVAGSQCNQRGRSRSWGPATFRVFLATHRSSSQMASFAASLPLNPPGMSTRSRSATSYASW